MPTRRGILRDTNVYQTNWKTIETAHIQTVHFGPNRRYAKRVLLSDF